MAAIFFLYLICFLISSTSSCPKICKCKITEVDCRDLNITDEKLPSILREIPNTSRKLILTSNKIKTLKPGIFEGVSQLEHLIINFNMIEKVQTGVFDCFPNLRYMSLSNNKITELQDNCFGKLNGLCGLQLEYNELTNLPVNSFKGLSLLINLYFHHNQINQLDENVFDDMENLKILSGHNNNLTELAPGLFNRLTQLEELNLSNNSLAVLPGGLLENLENLITFDASGNNITSLPSTLFKNQKKMKDVKLEYTTLQKMTIKLVDDLRSISRGLLKTSNSKLRILFSGKHECICSNFYTLSLLQKDAVCNYECFIDNPPPKKCFSGQIEGNKQILNACPEKWSSWVSVSKCYNRSDGFSTRNRKCISSVSQKTCKGFNTTSTPCQQYSYGKTTKIYGSIVVTNIRKNGTLQSSENLKTIIDNKGTQHNILAQILKRTVVWLYTNKDFNVLNVTKLELVNYSSSAKVKFKYDISLRHAYPVLKEIILLENDETVKLSTNGTNYEFKVIAWTIEHTEHNPCISGEHGCHENAHCWKSTINIGYACQCNDGYVGDGFYCQKAGSIILAVIQNITSGGGDIFVVEGQTAILKWIVTTRQKDLTTLILFKENGEEISKGLTSNFKTSKKVLNSSGDRLETKCDVIDRNQNICFLKISNFGKSDVGKYVLADIQSRSEGSKINVTLIKEEQKVHEERETFTLYAITTIALGGLLFFIALVALICKYGCKNKKNYQHQRNSTRSEKPQAREKQTCADSEPTGTNQINKFRNNNRAWNNNSIQSNGNSHIYEDISANIHYVIPEVDYEHGTSIDYEVQYS